MRILARVLTCAASIAFLTTPVYAFAASTNGGTTNAPAVSSSQPPTPAGSAKVGVKPNTAPGSCIYYAWRSQLETGSLTNGLISTNFCINAVNNVTEVHTNYQKTGGGAVTLRNFWEYTNSSGGSSGTRYYDAGAFTAYAGNTYPYAWVYYPNSIVHPGSYPCIHAGIRDIGAGIDYYTHVWCP